MDKLTHYRIVVEVRRGQAMHMQNGKWRAMEDEQRPISRVARLLAGEIDELIPDDTCAPERVDDCSQKQMVR